MKKDLDKKNEIAISVKNVSKTFKIPHEKITSLRGAVVSAYKKKGYEEFKALDDVSFEVKKGEFFGVIGRNGSGKSTLLKILAGIYQADKGKVRVHGMISPFLELGIGFNPELSGRDNIYLNATVLGMTKKQIDKKFDDIVKFSELERFIDQKLKNYSSGMQVRLAFSVSIHANRDILLMDEVLAVGDSNFQKKCIDIFRNYRSHGKTVVLVTHDMTSVRKYCSRAMLIHNGKMIKIGDVDRVCDEYVKKNITVGAKLEIKKKEKLENDEEAREEKLRAEMKNKLQTVVDINVLGDNKKELMVTTQGSSFFVNVNVDIKKLRKNMHLAVQIFDRATNCFISGNNTQIDNFDCKWKEGKNRISIEFENHFLNKGGFYVKAVLFEYNSAGDFMPLDELSSLEKNYFFMSERKKAGGGAIYLNHKWKKND
ncbi:MAG: ATP-binding cassette domain-containing protein [Sphingobacteriia bacterium]|nr:ATP-binding cassette domain-containing protein [Sphingobacteriia bacterium]